MTASHQANFIACVLPFCFASTLLFALSLVLCPKQRIDSGDYYNPSGAVLEHTFPGPQASAIILRATSAVIPASILMISYRTL